MSWTPCSICGADGYKLKSTILGWVAECPSCGLFLSYGVTRSDCIMNYTAVHRRTEA